MCGDVLGIIYNDCLLIVCSALHCGAPCCSLMAGRAGGGMLGQGCCVSAWQGIDPGSWGCLLAPRRFLTLITSLGDKEQHHGGTRQ